MSELMKAPRNLPQGLTSEEVRVRVAEGKVNGDQNIKTKSVGRILFEHFFTFFNFLFLSLAILLLFVIDHNMAGYANLGFMGVVITNLLIGVIQEVKAKRTIDKLSLLSAPKVNAMRDGVETEIPLEQIVLDDVIVLKTGDQICADGQLLEGFIEVNESQLTGEPDAIAKQQGDRLFSGSFVVSGSASYTVTAVGKDNYATKISAGAKYIKRTNSQILRSLNRLIKTMSLLILPLFIALMTIKLLQRPDSVDQTIISVVGTIIGMIPSGLVALSSAVFCVSVVRLARHKTLAQDLYCAESLARVDVLCLDKTGTITEGTMEVKGIESDLSEEEFRALLARFVAATGDSNPTADAIRLYAGEVASDALTTVPFSSQRKWSAANFEDGNYVLGAPEFIFGDFDPAPVAHYAEEGIRILALARAASPVTTDQPLDAPVLVGYVLLSDKIRKEAPDTLRFFAEQGVALKIISGDNPVTVKAIAARAGLQNADAYIDASTLHSDAEIADAVNRYTVFGRVSPDQKLAFVKALRAGAHTVGMTGDGVNDVLALKEADCSVAMAAGSDAAKNVAQLVLLDSNFASMPRIVAEGRRSINNLERSASLFLIKTMYNFLFAVIFMILSANLPFLPKQMTLLGALTIGIPSFVLALEPNSALVKGNFMRKILFNAAPAALTIVIAVVAATLYRPNLPYIVTNEQFSTMLLLITGSIAFFYLIYLCYPYNPIRIALCVVLIACFIATLFVDLAGMLFGISQNLPHDAYKLILIELAVALPFLAGLIALGRWLQTKDYVDRFVAWLGRKWRPIGDFLLKLVPKPLRKHVSLRESDDESV